MKRSVLILAALAALALGTSASAAPVFVIDGFGWGHAIGMSQYGASGLAAKGRSHAEVLAHYYRGTQLGTVDGVRMRVLVHVPEGAFSVVSGTPFVARGVDGTELEIPAGSVKVNKKLALILGADKVALALPFTFVPGEQPLEVGGRSYRGMLNVHDTKDGVLIVNDVGLESYLYGVVPDEMPPLWEMEALKAQAVAARSFALATRRASGVFDAYSDTRSQVYGGIASEHPRTTQAVDETRGQVVMHEGAIASTFFFSTSGGRTAAIEDVWRGSSPVPYLRSVADPTDAHSPYHRWGPIVFTRRGLQRALADEAPRGLRDVTTTTNASGRVDLFVMSSARAQAAIDGAAARTQLGLRSTGFSVGVLDLVRRAEPVGFARKIAIQGLARNIDGATLEARIDGVWTPLRAIETDELGDFVVRYRPRGTTVLRLVAPQLEGSRVRGPRIRIEVVARVTLERKRRGVFRGVVRPKGEGAPVRLQRFGKRRWRTVARDVTTQGGRYRFRLKPRPAGDYRVLAAPESATVGPGVSQTVTVP